MFYISKPRLMYLVHVYTDFHYSWRFRSSHPELFLVKSVLEKCSKFTGEYPYRSVIFIEVILRYEWSPANLLHIFRTRCTKNTCRLLLLKICTGANEDRSTQMKLFKKYFIKNVRLIKCLHLNRFTRIQSYKYLYKNIKLKTAKYLYIFECLY